MTERGNTVDDRDPARVALPPRTVPIRRVDLVHYARASGDANPIHLDPAEARSAGLPDVIAHGMLIMGLAIGTVTRWSGGRAGIRGCRARFLKPVVVPEETGTVIEITGEAIRNGAGDVTAELTVRHAGTVAARITATLGAPGLP